MCVYNYTYLTMQTVAEYYKREEDLKGKPPLNLSSFDDVAPVCYDAMWTFALALNNTIEGIQVYWCLWSWCIYNSAITYCQELYWVTKIECIACTNNTILRLSKKHTV